VKRTTQKVQVPFLEETLELAAITREAWPAIHQALRGSRVPLNDGEAGGEKTGGSGSEKGGDPGGSGSGQSSGSSGSSGEDGDLSADERKFDPAVQEVLRRERTARRDAEKRAGQNAAKVKEFEDSGKSELERAQGSATSEKQRADSAETTVAKYRAASKAGLPLDLAERLTGSTEAELDADAQKFKGQVGTGGGQQRASFDGGADRSSGQASGGSFDDAIRAGRRR